MTASKRILPSLTSRQAKPQRRFLTLNPQRACRSSPDTQRWTLRSMMPMDTHSLQPANRIRQRVQFVAEEALTGPRADLEDAIGTLDAQQGNWQEAQQRFEHAISLDNSYVRARIHLGMLFRAQKNLANALNTLSTAAAMNPPNAEALMEYGRALAAAGKDEEAVQQFNAAIQADSNLPGVQLELAMALQRLGRQQDAIPWFQKAIEREPHNSFGAHESRTWRSRLTGKGKEALDYFKRALAENRKRSHRLQGSGRLPHPAFRIRRSDRRFPESNRARSQRPAASLRSRPRLQVQRPAQTMRSPN